eukprot:Rhum_TRINITY_DN13501_c0_g1::Rhum_TRINITY_DN13501_c0_g1_i1::g.60734::m.60734
MSGVGWFDGWGCCGCGTAAGDDAASAGRSGMQRRGSGGRVLSSGQTTCGQQTKTGLSDSKVIAVEYESPIPGTDIVGFTRATLKVREDNTVEMIADLLADHFDLPTPQDNAGSDCSTDGGQRSVHLILRDRKGQPVLTTLCIDVYAYDNLASGATYQLSALCPKPVACRSGPDRGGFA